MNIQFYNSLTNQLEKFTPCEPGKVRMYSCGPTVYDFAHIGNFRSFLFGDLLRRFLELAGYDVHHVSNVTDVGHMVDDAEDGDDKMVVAMKKLKEGKKSYKVPEGAIENPDDPYQIADYFTNAYLEDGRKLGYKVTYEYPECVPKATENIPAMIQMIERLLDRGHAYVAADGVVYYSVESFPEYGKLSGNSLDRLQEGAGGRVSGDNQSHKKHPADFMLWKPDKTHVMKWDSPWGVGYPGWHIECSAMAIKFLGRDVIDIHTGGEDLIFPHHECEIAQSCGATGKDSFANFWIHARFLFVEGEKMSKSKGNFYTARDLFDGSATGSKVHPAVVRFELIKAHYRTNMNFTKKGLADSARTVSKLIEFRQMLESKTGGKAAEVDLSHPVLKEFAEALADDLNIAGALGVMHPWVKGEHPNPAESLGVWQKMNSVLSIAPINEGIEGAVEISDGDGGAGGGSMSMEEAQSKCAEIDAAKQDKDYGKADAIRAELLEAGFEVQQSKEGTSIKGRLA
jgi:cysteinyl-tRNA synthetase